MLEEGVGDHRHERVEPGFIAGHMLLARLSHPLRWSIGCAHTDRGEAGLELSLRAGTPGDDLPLGIGRHVPGRCRQNIGNRALTRTPAPGDWEDRLHAGWVT